jgi:hypothetical protein
MKHTHEGKQDGECESLLAVPGEPGILKEGDLRVKLRVERSEVRCGFKLGFEVWLWLWVRWWRRRMGVSGLVGWDACEDVVLVLAREVVDVDVEGVEMVWRGEVRILKVRARCCRFSYFGGLVRERLCERRWAWSWEGISR